MKTVSRRSFLSFTGVLCAGVLAAACAAPAAPTATTAPAQPAAQPTKPAAEPRPEGTRPAAEPTKPVAAAAPTNTAAPAAAPTNTPASAAAAATATPAAAKPATSGGAKTTVELWYLHPEWKDAMTGVIAAFQQKAPDVEVDVKAQPSNQYQNQLQTALNAGIGPDLFQAPTRPQLDVMSKTGQLLELHDKVDQKAWTQVAKDAVTVKGKVWAVPGGKYTVGIAYHQDLFEKAGIKDEPKTWQQTTEAFDRLKASGVTPYSIAIKDGSLTYFNYIGLASSVIGLDGLNQVNDGKLKLTEPDLVKVVQTMIDWSKYYQPNHVGTVYLEAKALFATKKAAAMDAGSSDFNGYKQINPDAKLGFMYWPMPAEGKGKQVTNTGMEFTVGVNAKSKVAEPAVTFAAWLASPPGAQAMADNVKNLPVLEGVTVKDPQQQKMIATPHDVPVWYERFATQNVGKFWSEKGQAPFEGKMSAAEAAQGIQDTVDEQLRQPQD
jgi:raffinose/stachyose/melibiose transport system substrate-binding protein